MKAGFMAELQRVFDIKDVGPISFCLGVRVQRDEHSGSITLSMPAYIEDLLEKLRLSSISGHKTPMVPGQVPSADDCPTTAADKEAMKQGIQSNYRSVIGTLMYLAGACRPDISYAVNSLARFTTNPGMAHWQALVYLLGYLKETATEGITYTGVSLQGPRIEAEARARARSMRRGGVPNPSLSSESYLNNLVAYADADFASDTVERRSTSGWAVYLNGGPVSWRSHRQKSVSLSTTEAELYSLSDCLQEVIWLQRVLIELGYPQPTMRVGPGLSNSGTVIYEDNKGARDGSKNYGSVAGRSKHMGIRKNFVQWHVNVGTISVTECSSEEMVADLLTKPVGSVVHRKLFAQLMGIMLPCRA